MDIHGVKAMEYIELANGDKHWYINGEKSRYPGHESAGIVLFSGETCQFISDHELTEQEFEEALDEEEWYLREREREESEFERRMAESD